MGGTLPQELLLYRNDISTGYIVSIYTAAGPGLSTDPAGACVAASEARGSTASEVMVGLGGGR